MHAFSYSDTGLALTKRFEGLRLEAYQDCGGVWTIGYGHTGSEIKAGQRIDGPKAESLLRIDLQAAIGCVNGSVHADVALAQHQFDALVDFCFNVGQRHFQQSSLLRCVNGGDFDGAAREFGLWVDVGQRAIQGLVQRRAAEAALFVGLWRAFAEPLPAAEPMKLGR